MLRNIISWFIAAIMAIVGFFGGLFGIGGNKPAEPTVPPTETTTLLQKPQPQNFAFSSESLQELGLTPHTIPMDTIDSADREYTRIYTGVLVKDFLAAMGVNLALLDGESTLLVIMSDNAAGVAFGYDIIMSDRALLAWDMDGAEQIPPRFAPGNTNHGAYLKNVVSVTVNY